MSVESTIPENINFLSPMKFRFFIKKTPHLNFFTQQVNLPSIELPPTSYENPWVVIPEAGDHIVYEDLKVSFKVDEDLENYLEIHNWIRGLGFPTDFKEYKDLKEKKSYTGEGLVSDISLMMLSNKDNPIFEVTYIDAFPYYLSGIQFSSTNKENQVTATAHFKYTYYDITRLKILS